MREFDLYFVGYIKHGEVQYLESGPYIDFDSAEAAVQSHEFASSRKPVVVKATLPFEVVRTEA